MIRYEEIEKLRFWQSFTTLILDPGLIRFLAISDNSGTLFIVFQNKTAPPPTRKKCLDKISCHFRQFWKFHFFLKLKCPHPPQNLFYGAIFSFWPLMAACKIPSLKRHTIWCEETKMEFILYIIVNRAEKKKKIIVQFFILLLLWLPI